MQRAAEPAAVASTSAALPAGGEEEEEQDFAAEMRAKVHAKRRAQAPEPVQVDHSAMCAVDSDACPAVHAL